MRQAAAAATTLPPGPEAARAQNPDRPDPTSPAFPKILRGPGRGTQRMRSRGPAAGRRAARVQVPSAHPRRLGPGRGRCGFCLPALDSLESFLVFLQSSLSYLPGPEQVTS